jgi:hypothetical protein
MRARNVLLALIILAGGLLVTAYYQGRLPAWSELGNVVMFPHSLAMNIEELPLDQTETYSDVIDETNVQTLTIDNPNGNIIVRSGDVPRIEYTVKRFGRRLGHEAWRNSQKIKLETINNGSEVVIRAHSSLPNKNWLARLDLTVTVPRALDVNVSAFDGSVSIGGLTREVSATTNSGQITINGGENVTATSSNGAIEISNVAKLAEVTCQYGSIQIVDANTVKAVGDAEPIVLKRIAGGVTATTGRGAVTLRDYTGEDAYIQTGEGSIDITIPKPFSGALSATSTGDGAVGLALPVNSNCTVSLQARESSAINSSLSLRQQWLAKGRLKGVLGNGKGKVELRGELGSVSIRSLATGNTSAQ